MTALAGVLSLDGGIDAAAALQALMQAQARRGPDGQRSHSQGPLALGECVLHPKATPLTQWPRQRQPLAQLDALTLIWDGRLDNRAELVALLRAKGDPVQTIDETEDDRWLLLRLWRCLGAAVLPRLLGDFALAVWDAQRRELTLARDAMGARPLYYTAQRGVIAWASEDEALLAVPGVPADAAPERLAYALFPGFTAFDWSQSWLREVRILMPGTSLRITAQGQRELNTWWHWSVPQPQRFATDEQAVEAFGEVFVRATADRTRDLDAIGLIASGGLDTAAIAVAVQSVRGARPLRMFSAVSDPAGDCIETRAIETLAQTLSAELHRLRLPALEGLVDAQDLAAFYARPHPVAVTIPLIAMMCLGASRAGQRVLLHGATGDLALYAPDDYLVRFAQERGLRAAWQEAYAAQRHHTYRQGVVPARQWARSAYDAWVPPLGKLAWRELRRRLGQRASDDRLAPPEELQRLLRVNARQRAQTLRFERAAWRAPRTSREHLQALFPIGVVRGLEGYERVAGAYGVELRDPWADRRVIEFCLQLPLHWRTREGWTKYIARRWAGQALPPVCVWRSDKTHLGYHLLAQAPTSVGRSNGAARSLASGDGAEEAVWRWAWAQGGPSGVLPAFYVALLQWLVGRQQPAGDSPAFLAESATV